MSDAEKEARKALADAIALRLERVEKTAGNSYKTQCPRCRDHSFWVSDRGFSCSGCNWKSVDLWKLDAMLDERDQVGVYAPDYRYEPEPDPPPPFDRVLGTLLDEINIAKQQPVDAVPTPFPIWNKCCRDEGGGIGLARGWHVIVAGNPGMGKSLLALNIAAHAVKQGEKVGLLSLEMSQMQAVTRFMSIFSGQPVMHLEHGDRYVEDTAFTAKAMLEENFQRNGGVMVTNRKQISKLSDIERAMKWLFEYEGCRYFITDYMQLAWTGQATNMLDRITEVSHTIRQTSTDLDVISVGLSQFNRGTSASKESPSIQGLMGGSALENDAEQILMIDHASYEKKAMGSAIVKLILGKNRHGPDGKIPMAWDYTTLRAYQTEHSRFGQNGDGSS